jgi:hypothetical protein
MSIHKRGETERRMDPQHPWPRHVCRLLRQKVTKTEAAMVMARDSAIAMRTFVGNVWKCQCCYQHPARQVSSSFT